MVSFNIGEEIRDISSRLVWSRRVMYVVVWVMGVGNVLMLFDKMPNKIVFPLYALTLAMMVTCAIKRYEFTTPYSFGFIIVGSLLFGVSDNLLGFLKFN